MEQVKNSPAIDEQDELLRIENLSVEYHASGSVAKAVNHLSLTIKKGEALGLVGESGAGKTTTALSILQLLPNEIGIITQGDIKFQGESLLNLSEKQMNNIRGKSISMVFANPLTSLNPVFPVGEQITMSIRSHNKKITKKEAETEAEKLLEAVGIASYRAKDYPHQFSGGMRQRVGIAAALASSPQLLLADEPTTALDVTIQAQILELIKDLQSKYSMSLLMITHNLGIIAELCQRVAIMYGGEIVEYGDVRKVFESPKHYYTLGLLHAIPKLTGPKETLESIPGLVANAQDLPEGCKFHVRCKHCTDKCKSQVPPLEKIEEDHYVACWKWRTDNAE